MNVAIDPQRASDPAWGGRDVAGEHRPTSLLLVPWIVLLVAAFPVAASAFFEGRKDWQYQLAGLADPFLGRPAPGFTIAIGVVASVLLALGVWIGHLIVRRGESRDVERPKSSRFRARWWFVLVAGWLAFALGIASVAAAGGQLVYEGTMQMAFGSPISSTIVVPATCWTPVGNPDLVAEIAPRAQGLHRVLLRNVATGERQLWPAPTGVFVELLGGGAAATAYELPNVPARLLPYIEMTLADGERHADPPVGFLGAYNYRAVEFAEDGLTGRAEVEGARFPEPFGGGTGPGTIRWVNLEVPNDPWPPTIAIGIEWTCRP